MDFALYSYIPKRKQRKASFEEKDLCRKIIGFKDGRNVYTRWAAYSMANILAGNDLSDVCIVCIPASTHAAHVRRWKRFSRILCTVTGAQNGFEHVNVFGNRKRAHVTHSYELSTNIKHYVVIDKDFFDNRKVIVIDDIYTTGQSSRAFVEAMTRHGAKVVGTLFLAKTRRFVKQ